MSRGAINELYGGTCDAKRSLPSAGICWFNVGCRKSIQYAGAVSVSSPTFMTVNQFLGRIIKGPSGARTSQRSRLPDRRVGRR